MRLPMIMFQMRATKVSCMFLELGDLYEVFKNNYSGLQLRIKNRWDTTSARHLGHFIGEVIRITGLPGSWFFYPS